MSKIYQINRRKFIQYGSLTLGSGILAACTDNSQTPTGNASPAASPAGGSGKLDKVTYGTNWYAQAEHGGFYQAIATGIYQRTWFRCHD
jgi:NitT/TauT family transport system substrate-binding protein